MDGLSQQLSLQVALYIDHYIDQDTPSDDQTQTLKSIAWNVQEGSLNLKDLITELGTSFVSVSDNERSRAAQLLGEVISLVPGSMQSKSTQEHMVQFFTSRLSDWPSVHGCLKGIAGLQSAAEVQPNETAMIVRALLEVHITNLPQTDRMMALTILSRALQAHGTELVLQSEVDVLRGVIASIDGEKDPRCLMLSFQLAQQVICIYEEAVPQVASAKSSLDDNKEELFDVIACYFPISFSPPPNNVHGITRQDLAAALQHALTCTPLFAPFFIPMLVEKLSSSLRQAKLDALTALSAAAEGYGPPGVHPHLPTVWLALRAELLAPAAPALLPADLVSAQQIAEKAAECVTRSITALGRQGDDSLVRLVLADEQVCGDLLECLSGLKQRESQNPALRVEALTRVAATVVEGSLSACQSTCKRLLPPLATAASDAQSLRQEHGLYHKPHQTEQLALSAILGIVKAAVKAAAANAESTIRDQMSSGDDHMQTVNGHGEEDGEDPLAGTGAVVFDAVTGISRQEGQRISQSGGDAASVWDCPGEGLGEGLAGGVRGKSGGDAEMSDSAAAIPDRNMQQLAGKVKGQDGITAANKADDSAQYEIELLQLQVLTELVSFPAASSTLSAQELEDALRGFLNCLNTTSSNGDTAAKQATSALTRMAGAGHTKLLEQKALESLLDSAIQTRPGQQGPWQGALPLQALAALAAPSSLLRRHILSSMQQLVPAMLAASIGNEHNQQMVVAMLQVIRHKLAPFAEEESEAAGSLGLNLLTGLVQLTTAGQAAAEEVAIACAQAVQAAVAGCHPSQQALIYQLASSQLDQSCCQLPPTSVFPAASDPPGSFDPSTGPQQAGSSQQPATLHAREQFESTAAPEDTMSAPNSTGIAHSLHSAEEMSRLPAQSAVVSAAAIAALRPDALPHDRAMPLLECLVKLAMQLSQGCSREACMVAAAAVVNKWPAGSVALDDAIASVLQLLGIADLAQPVTAPRAQPHKGPTPCSFTCLAHILKGACMAGHKAALALIALPLSYLDSVDGRGILSDPAGPDAQANAGPGSDATLLTSAVSVPVSTPQAVQPPAGNTAGSQCCQAAAATFEMVPSNTTSVLSLSHKMAHAVAKPLWQQRFYTVALQQLEKLLTHPQSTDSLSPAEEASQGLTQQGPLLLALAYLLKGTPAKMSKADLPRLLKWLLMALEVLQQPHQGADKFIIAGLLELVKTMIEDSTGRAIVEPEVQTIISTLTSLTCSKESSLRVSSLQCLIVIMELPYHLLHPLRKQVLAALASSIDDNIRRVRQEAVKCLKAWSST